VIQKKTSHLWDRVQFRIFLSKAIKILLLLFPNLFVNSINVQGKSHNQTKHHFLNTFSLKLWITSYPETTPEIHWIDENVDFSAALLMAFPTRIKTTKPDPTDKNECGSSSFSLAKNLYEN
jgi:hypothetical protein